jgi:hypothetical protein
MDAIRLHSRSAVRCPIDPATYGGLVRDGKVLSWLSGTPSGTHTTATN